jgi:hypothetical protein
VLKPLWVPDLPLNGTSLATVWHQDSEASPQAEDRPPGPLRSHMAVRRAFLPKFHFAGAP